MENSLEIFNPHNFKSGDLVILDGKFSNSTPVTIAEISPKAGVLQNIKVQTSLFE